MWTLNRLHLITPLTIWKSIFLLKSENLGLWTICIIWIVDKYIEQNSRIHNTIPKRNIHLNFSRAMNRFKAENNDENVLCS